MVNCDNLEPNASRLGQGSKSKTFPEVVNNQPKGEYLNKTYGTPHWARNFHMVCNWMVNLLVYRVFHSGMRETKAIDGHLELNFHP